LPYSSEILLMNLARLRSNAVFALENSAGTVVSLRDIWRLESAAETLFGVALAGIEWFPLVPDEWDENPWTSVALLSLLPRPEASTMSDFLSDLHRRTHSWLSMEIP
jgi:hypothetical protein